MNEILGSINLDGHKWAINCKAHVRTKLRRCFPEVFQGASETIHISDNIENCRDLLWFTERYPMTIEPRGYMEQRAKAHVDLSGDILFILNNPNAPKRFELAHPPRDYQCVAGSMLQTVKGLLLADDVGLGKTVSAICNMNTPEHLPVLVVTLTHLPSQWEREIARFAPQLKTHILKSGKVYPLTSQNPNATDEEKRFPDVIITNYAKLNGWAETLKGVIRYVVFDEIQELRRMESLKYSAAKHVAAAAELKIGLSATPIYNYGDEFFNVIDVLRPDCLGSKQEFMREWTGESSKIKDPRAFGEYLRSEGIMLRRTRKDVGRELPPVSKIHQYVESDVKVLEKIQGDAVELAKVILASQQSYKGEKFRAAEEFNILMRQATGIAKAPYVAEFVSLLVESGEKVVLFGWHREVYSIWLERLARFKPKLYTGTENPKEKEAAKEAFVNGDCQVLIISLRSGAGLDGLQSCCSTAVFGELDWSPGVHEQCLGRIDRDGQPNPVTAWYLIADEGSDPIIADVLGIKLGQIEGVRNPDGELFERLSVESGGVKRLAETYLDKMGVHLPAPTIEIQEAKVA